MVHFFYPLLVGFRLQIATVVKGLMNSSDDFYCNILTRRGGFDSEHQPTYLWLHDRWHPRWSCFVLYLIYACKNDYLLTWIWVF